MENKSKLKWESFQSKLGNWDSKIYPFYLDGGFDRIYEKLKFDAKRGIKLAPESHNTFRAFEECDYNNLKAIIVGLSPYHSLNNGVIVADGLCLSCSITKYPQPSLSTFFDALEREFHEGLCVPCERNTDLKYLASQGVLLLNAALTTPIGKPGDHVLLWDEFMKFLFEKVLDVQSVPIILLGKEAQKLEKYINPFNQVFKLSHPSFAARSGIEWDTENTFIKVNKILEYKHGKGISWFDEEELLPF